VQTRSKVVLPVSAEEVSVPDDGRAPVHPFDAVHAVALVLVHESAVVPFAATLVGAAVNAAVGAGGGPTVIVTELVVSPPDPEQVSVKVLEAVRAGVASAPDVPRLPVHVPDAVHDVALLLVHLSCSVAPYASVGESSVSWTVGAGGGGGGGGGGGAPVTVTAAVAVPLPPVPVHVSVKLVLAVSALLVALPLVDCPPDQPPDAVHELAFVLVHASCVLAPLATLDGVAVRLTVGAGTTVTVFESLAVPPVPVQLKVKVVLEESAPLVSLPTGGLVPDQPPDAEHDVAALVVHASCVVPPVATLAGLTVRLTVGAATAATAFESLAVPPLPVQVNVKVVFVDRALLVALPLADLAPAQPPDALHDVALVLVHDSCVVPPIGTVLGLTCSETVGAGADVVCVVALAGADCPDSLRFGLRSNAATV
jgi:hypothetical protein